MKIALIGQKGIPARSGGIERHVEELSIRLAKAGHEVFVYSRKHYTQYQDKKYKGVNLIYLPSLKTKHLDAITHTLFASVDALRRDFDIIHYQGVGPSTLAFIPRILKRKAKVISTFHCRDQFHQKWGLIARMYLKFGEFSSCKFPHQAIGVSKIIRNLGLKKYNANIDYIPNGVAIQKHEGYDAIRKFGLKPNSYVMTCARLVKHKGIHYLIKAFIELKREVGELKLKELKLVIVGDSAYTDDYVAYLKKLAKGREDIVFTGFQSGKNLSQLFSNAYVYAHPSESEGLPITVLEAMQYGNTVLVSNIPENIEAFAGNGYMFENKNVDDLKYKLKLLIENPQLVAETGVKAAKYVSKNYNWEDITKNTINLYSRVLATQMVEISESTQRA